MILYWIKEDHARNYLLGYSLSGINYNHKRADVLLITKEERNLMVDEYFYMIIGSANKTIIIDDMDYPMKEGKDGNT